MSYLVPVVIAIVGIFWMILKKQRKQAGITGWVKTHDLDGKSKHIYRDKKSGIATKPDVVEGKKVIEYKSAAGSGKPRWVDLLQVALQLKSTKLKKAEIRYANNQRFELDRDESVMKVALSKALHITRKMQWHLRTGIPPKATPSKNRCAVCVFSALCLSATK